MQPSKADFVQQNPQRYVLSGKVDFSSVPALQKRSVAIVKGLVGETNNALYVDWSAVKTSDSAALALILEMAKTAKTNNIKLQFEHLPDTLLTIAKAYGVEDEIRDIGK